MAAPDQGENPERQKSQRTRRMYRDDLAGFDQHVVENEPELILSHIAVRENDVCSAIWADWYGFKMESYDLKPGDEILITGKKTGVVESVVQELRVDGKPADSAKRGDSITIPLGKKIHSSDKLYKLVKTAE